MSAAPARIALRYLLQAQESIKMHYPPPYNWPSDEQNAAQIVADAIEELTVIVNKETP